MDREIEADRDSVTSPKSHGHPVAEPGWEPGFLWLSQESISIYRLSLNCSTAPLKLHLFRKLYAQLLFVTQGEELPWELWGLFEADTLSIANNLSVAQTLIVPTSWVFERIKGDQICASVLKIKLPHECMTSSS